VDLYRARYPAEPGFSWWDYRAGGFHRNEGMRIDLLLATPVVADRVTDVYVDREYRKKGKTSGAVPSDHAPVVAAVASGL
jgi:exodeoxyribonuclease-3